MRQFDSPFGPIGLGTGRPRTKLDDSSGLLHLSLLYAIGQMKFFETSLRIIRVSVVGCPIFQSERIDPKLMAAFFFVPGLKVIQESLAFQAQIGIRIFSYANTVAD